MLRNKSGVAGGGWPRVSGGKARREPRPMSPPRRVVETVDSDGEAAPAPGYRQSFSDAIAAALENASMQTGK